MGDTDNTTNVSKTHIALDVEEATYQKLSLMAERHNLTVPKLVEQLLDKLGDSE
ncbi:MAG: hypothetical protein ACPG3X_06510 [Opitutales bacterium]